LRHAVSADGSFSTRQIPAVFRDSVELVDRLCRPTSGVSVWISQALNQMPLQAPLLWAPCARSMHVSPHPQFLLFSPLIHASRGLLCIASQGPIHHSKRLWHQGTYVQFVRCGHEEGRTRPI